MAEISQKETKENLREVERAWFLDVDGVVTNPDTKKVDPKLAQKIAQALDSGEPVALVTGRSLDWLNSQILPQIKKFVDDETALENLFLSGEKGASWQEFLNRQIQTKHDESIKVPLHLSQISKILSKNKKFSPFVFFDPTKKTMVSIEIYGGEDKNEVLKQKEALSQMAEELQAILSYSEYAQDFEIDHSEIAVDIQHKMTGKDLATRRVLSWLSKKRINPQTIIAVGDSRSDKEIGEELERKKRNFQFWYVGRQQLGDSSFPIFQTEGKFDRGTLKIFQRFLGS